MSKRKKLFVIDGRFIHRDAEFLWSPAYRALDPIATKALGAFEAHLVQDQRNGQLQVPRDSVMEWMNYHSKRALAGPLQQLYTLGFIRPTGRRTVRLTYPHLDIPPTHEWKSFTTPDQALKAIGKKPRRERTPEFQAKLALGEWPKAKGRK